MVDVEGTLHIVRLDKEPAGSQYAATFAPYHSRGGALPQLRLPNREALTKFLLEIGIPETQVDKVFEALSTTGSVSLQKIVLSSEDLRRYGLSELGIGESILRYLST